MNISRNDLEKQYENVDDEKLIELSLQDLTPLAKEVVNAEIKKRNISVNEIEIQKSIVKEEKRDERKLNIAIATPLTRFKAQLIDTFIAIILSMLASFLFSLGNIAQFAGLIALTFFFLYIFLADGLFKGQSIGKKITNTAVIIERTGEPCNFPMSFLRNFMQIFGIIDGAFIFGKKRQRLGDIVAGTIVVNLKYWNKYYA